VHVLRPLEQDEEEPEEGAPVQVEEVSFHFNSTCWRALDPDVDWLWEEESGPASIVVQGPEPGPDATREGRDWAVATTVVGMLARALEKRDVGDVGSFQRLVDEAEDLQDPVFSRLHAREAADRARLLSAAEWALPPRAATAMEEAIKAGHAQVVKSTQEAVCWLCGLDLATGDVLLLHGRGPDSYDQPMASHFHCAWRGENRTGAWPGPDGGPASSSIPFTAMVGIRTYVAAGVPLSPAEFSWRERRHKKAVKAAIGAMAEGWRRHARQSADRLARQVERWSKIVRNRSAGSKEPTGT